MAGTRLYVVSSFLVPFLVWTLFSGWKGLRNDLVWKKLRSLVTTITGSTKLPTPNNSMVPWLPLEVHVADTHFEFWKTGIQQPGFQVLSISDKKEHRALCDTNTLASNRKGVVLCEPQPNSRPQPELNVVTADLALFYPTSTAKRIREFRNVFYTEPHRGEESTLHVELWMDPDVPKEERISAVKSVNHWIRQQQALESSCFASFAFTIDPKVELEVQKKDGSSSLKKASLIKRLSSLDETRRLVAYLPYQNETLISGELQAFVGPHYFTILVKGVESLALDKGLHALISSACWALHESLAVQESSDATYDFMDRYFYAHRRVVRESAKVTKRVQETAVLLSSRPSQTTIETYHQALAHLDNRNDDDPPETLLATMMAVDRLLTKIHQDPSLAPMADFPLDQYAAIFAPLLFPLLLPVVFTMIREVKRYRAMVQSSS